MTLDARTAAEVPRFLNEPDSRDRSTSDDGEDCRDVGIATLSRSNQPVIAIEEPTGLAVRHDCDLDRGKGVPSCMCCTNGTESLTIDGARSEAVECVDPDEDRKRPETTNTSAPDGAVTLKRSRPVRVDGKRVDVYVHPRSIRYRSRPSIALRLTAAPGLAAAALEEADFQRRAANTRQRSTLAWRPSARRG